MLTNALPTMFARYASSLFPFAFASQTKNMSVLHKTAPILLTLLVLGLSSRNIKADPVFLGPSPYLSFANSPFNSITFTYFHLENHEDGFFNPPGVTANGFAVIPVQAPAAFVDSVDGDDGSIDGSGQAGRSLGNGTNSWSFVFNAGVLGSLPTHAGIVWTDVGFSASGLGFGFDGVTFQAFDAMGNSLGTAGPVVVGDGSNLGGTAEDRFLGVINSGGISEIRITMSTSMDWEVDHLQFGSTAQAVPEPATLLLLGTGLAGIAAKVRKRRYIPRR